MALRTTPYGIGVTLNLGYADAVDRTREALSKEGFGILSEIDISATLKKKLDVDFRPYVILGACNPPLAHQALSAERELGLLLPCNVIVYAGDKEGESVVAAMDPVAALALTGNEAIGPVAGEVRERLERVLEDLAGTTRGTGAGS
jgi:uncharacterized protein (DUF302 family)